MFKKIFCLMVAGMMSVAGMGVTAMAEDVENVDANPTASVTTMNNDYYYNVSPEKAKGKGIPAKEWNISEEGSYDFAGVTESPTQLYTNYYFVGQDKYYVTVNNNADAELTVLLKSRFKTYKTVTVDPYDSLSFTATGMDDNTKVYLLFKGSPKDFDGHIS